MEHPIKSFAPNAFVEDLQVSISFYEKLGFSLENSFTPHAGGQGKSVLVEIGEGRSDARPGKGAENSGAEFPLNDPDA